MPAIASGKVLVTGANGYIGAWIVNSLLEAGYIVRAVVRSEDKTSHLRKTFTSYGDALEFHIVPDMMEPGAYDEAVEGVDVVIHASSPVTFTAKDADEIIGPALQGTTRMLEAALAHGDTVKRVVLTSSVGAMIGDDGLPHQGVDESVWNEYSLNEISEKGREAKQTNKYCASKVVAERAAWAFMEEHKGEISWDLVVLHPPYVCGPVLHAVDSPEHLNASMLYWYGSVFSKVDDPDMSLPWVEVRDLAEAYPAVLRTAHAGNQRIIIHNGSFTWQDWINAVRKAGGNPIEGNRAYDPTKVTHYVTFDNSKSVQLLGINYRSIEETTRGIVGQFMQKGWIPVA